MNTEITSFDVQVQDCSYKEILHLKGGHDEAQVTFRCRIDIHTGGGKALRSAYLQFWEPPHWKHVHEIYPSNMETPEGCSSEEGFQKDRERLIVAATAILFSPDPPVEGPNSFESLVARTLIQKITREMGIPGPEKV